MSKQNGYIKLHRKLVDWEWYDSYPEFKLFLHLLLTVNHAETEWHGEKIQRGCRITSLASLSAETGLSIQQIRTALKHLKSTGEVTSLGRAKNTLFIVVNYDLYQGNNTITNNQVTNNQQTTNKQLTTNNNDKNEKNDKNDLKEERFKEEKSDSAPSTDSALLTSDDEKSSIGNHIERIESILGKTLSSNDLQALVEYRQSLPDEVIAKAIDIAKTNKARNFRYIDKILNDWKQSKVKSVADVELLLTVRVKGQKAQTTNQLPDWFNNPDAVQVDTSDFDEKEMLRDLEELKVLKEGAA